MKKTGTYLFLIISWLFSKLPEFVLYGIADIIYIFLYYLLGYRKKTVFKNLTKSFPDKSDDEIKHITKKFFHHLSEIFVENIAIKDAPVDIMADTLSSAIKTLPAGGYETVLVIG